MTSALASVRLRPRCPTARPARTPAYVNAVRVLLYGGLLAAAVSGSPVVRAAAICALPLAVLGDCAGGVRQLLRLLGLGLSIWLAAELAIDLGQWGNRGLALPPMVGSIAGAGLLTLSTLIVVGSLTRAIYRPLRRQPHLCGVDHVFGGLVGTAEGLVVVAALGCWLLASFAGPVERLRARLPAEVDGPHRRILDTLSDVNTAVQQDTAGRWLTRTNPLVDWPAIQTARLVAEVVAAPDRLLAAIENGQLEALGELPEIRKYGDAFRADPALRAALERHDLATVVAHSQVLAMLSDRALHRALREHHSELERALGTARCAQVEAEDWQRQIQLQRRMQQWAEQDGHP